MQSHTCAPEPPPPDFSVQPVLRFDVASCASTDVTRLRRLLCNNIEIWGRGGEVRGRRRVTKCRLSNSINRLSIDLGLLLPVPNHAKPTSVLPHWEVYSSVFCVSDPDATSLDVASTPHVLCRATLVDLAKLSTHSSKTHSFVLLSCHPHCRRFPARTYCEEESKKGGLVVVRAPRRPAAVRCSADAGRATPGSSSSPSAS